MRRLLEMISALLAVLLFFNCVLYVVGKIREESLEKGREDFQVRKSLELQAQEVIPPNLLNCTRQTIDGIDCVLCLNPDSLCEGAIDCQW